MKRFWNYLKTGKGYGLIPVAIFTILLTAFMGYAIYSFLGFYSQAYHRPMPPTSVIMLQVLLPMTGLFFVMLWASYALQTFWEFFLVKIGRFKIGKGAIWRVSMATMIFSWFVFVALLFTPVGQKLWMILNFYSTSLLSSFSPSILRSPWIFLPIMVSVFALVWSFVPALLGMITLIFLRDTEKTKVLPVKKETKKKA